MDKPADRLESHQVPHRFWPHLRRSSLDPYCFFKSDKERRLALRSRDVRNVLIAALVVFGGQGQGPELWAILRSLFI